MKSVKILSSYLRSSQTRIVAVLLVALSIDPGNMLDLRLVSLRYLRENTAAKAMSIALCTTTLLILRCAIPSWNTYFQARSIEHWLAQTLPSLQHVGLELVLLKLHRCPRLSWVEKEKGEISCRCVAAWRSERRLLGGGDRPAIWLGCAGSAYIISIVQIN